MSRREPVEVEPMSRLSRYLRNLAAFLIAALALTSVARSVVQMVDRARARIRKLWAPSAP